MTSREVTARAMEFKQPPRIPLNVFFNGGPHNDAIRNEVWAAFSPNISDIIMTFQGDPLFVPEEEGLTEWGYRWDSFGETRGEVTDPPIKDWSDFDAWRDKFPDFSTPRRYSASRKLRADNPDKFIIAGLGLQATEHVNLRGFGPSMEDLYIERENVERLLDVIYTASAQMIDGYASAGADAVISWEDWGLQDRAIIDPKLWREIYFDRMKKIVDRAHKHGMKYILHSCGYIPDYFDMFIELGIDALSLDQQLNMGLETLSKWRGRICFCNPVDIQHSPKMSDAEIKDHAHRMAKLLGTEDGGFIYNMYADPKAIQMPAKNIISEIQAFQSVSLTTQ